MPEFDATLAYRLVAGFPGYLVGSDGTVWSCRIAGGGLKRQKGVPWFGTAWKRMTPSSNGARIDYLVVGLHRTGGGKPTMRKVHRLVLEAFVGPRPAGMECCHNDGDRKNNRLANLRWAGRIDNVADRIRHGRQSRGEAVNRKVLTTELVKTIRRLKAEGLTGNTIAIRLSLKRQTVYQVLRRETWRHVT